MAGLGFVLTQVSGGSIAFRILMGIVGLAFVASMLFALAVLYPRSRASETWWRSLWPADESEVIQMFAPTESDNSAADHLAKIVCVKYRSVQWSIFLMAVAALPAVGAIIAGIAS
ncbi:hypothetical protein [Actinomadura sp. B10D3]|uniref:hypothetical protein n=1 Tax=Actinomadura sp. B10D3 TaxID=3153557 RepID=UPI00325D61FF